MPGIYSALLSQKSVEQEGLDPSPLLSSTLAIIISAFHSKSSSSQISFYHFRQIVSILTCTGISMPLWASNQVSIFYFYTVGP